MAFTPGPIEPAIDALDEHITQWVLDGFATRAEIIESAIWLARNLLNKHRYSEEMLRPHAERITDQRIAEHLEKQKSWPSTTDCDRLDAAFVDLNRENILALQHCGGDHTDAGAYLWCNAVPEAEAAGRRLAGYVFYNQQTTEAATRGQGLWMVCGAIPEPGRPEYMAAAARIAAIVVDRLRRHGLKASTRPNSDVVDVMLDWKRRRRK